MSFLEGLLQNNMKTNRPNPANDKMFFHRVGVKLMATRLLNEYRKHRASDIKNLEAEGFAEFWVKKNVRGTKLKEEVADKFIELLGKASK